jgi:RimJ/RimL family protein N-acetyltransferase
MNPILLDFPDAFASDRLLIRCPRAGDGQAMFEGIAESLAELKPWLPWAHAEQSVQASEALARRKHAQWLLREDLMLSLFRKEDGQYVGGSGLHRINWDVPKFEIGYWCRTSLAGQGYIRESTEAITRFAFDVLKARRVEIHVDDRNERSWRIPERLGFVLEGILRHEALDMDGNARDARVYARTA